MKSDPQMSFLRKQESTLLAFSLDSRVRGSDKEYTMLSILLQALRLALT